jgi:DNA recombination protein RmuC
MVVAIVLIACTAGGAGAWLLLRPRIRALETSLDRTVAERDVAQDEVKKIEPELYALRERLAARVQLEEELEARLGTLSNEALKQGNQSLVETARSEFERLHIRSSEELRRREQAVEHLVKPIRETLERVGNEVKSLEQSRREDQGALTTHLRLLGETNERLRSETGQLVTALRAPAVRGRWGEMQLRRAVEMAGMLDHCDFVEQPVGEGDTVLRPDLVVRLPGGRNVVVDAKTPLQALLDALDAADDDARSARLQDFARHVRSHIAKLSAKTYWKQFTPAPDFVVMFLPGESFYRAALEQDPRLLEASTNQRVVLASPMSLISLLLSVAVGWREEKVAESARAMNDLGRELYDRLVVMTEHFTRLGTRLNGAVQAYNQTVGSYERRVLVSARRFTDHGVGATKELVAPEAIERTTQPPRTIELPQRGADPIAEPHFGEEIDAA